MPWLLAAGAVCAVMYGAEFQSPGGVKEECVSGVRVPGGRYTQADAGEEQRLCSIDFHSVGTALCPKTWSTSPATIVYDVSSGQFAQNAAGFEAQSCGKGGRARRDAAGELAIYKMSMNAQDTSGTFAPASLVYYHLSRYFETAVKVPVAVYRTIDREAHARRVIEPGLRYTTGKPQLRMVHAGWRHLEQAATKGGTFAGTKEVVMPDGRRLFGVLLTETGIRYGAEINGTRASKGIEGQNRDFQQTPAYRALRSDQPLLEAIRSAGGGAGDAQMAFWMRELTEVILLDYILGQQDRIGNIDYTVESYASASGPIRLKRTWLNDNDAGVRASYADFAKRTHMLDGVAHFSATTYRKLMRLNSDLTSKGALNRFLAGEFGLSEAQMSLIEQRARESSEIVKKACKEKRLRFDLEPERLLASGAAGEEPVDCEGR
jgi:hypothetical protein